MNTWPTATLDDVLDDILDRRGVTPLKLNSGFAPIGHRVISAKLVKGGSIDLEADEPRFVDTDTYRRWMRTPLLPGDVVLTSEAPLGEVAYVGERLEWCLGQRLFALRSNAERLHGRFLYYALQSAHVRDDLLSRATGTTAQGIRQTELRKVSVPIPPIEEQEGIAAVLGSLDDKIEVNHRMSQTLAFIAQAIFKSWFVDFEPVRAKAAGESAESIGQRLGIAQETLAQFPASLSAAGSDEVPVGWKRRPLTELTSYLSRGVSPKYVEAGGVLVLNQKCIRDQRISVKDARRHDPMERAIQGRELAVGDVLVNSTGVGTLGRVAQVMSLEETTIVDSHVTVVRANLGETTANYLGMALCDRQAEIEALGEGSTGQTELSRARLGAMSILAPPVALLAHFDERTAGLRRAVDALERESQALARTRDALLPRLLSGELRVGEELGA